MLQSPEAKNSTLMATKLTKPVVRVSNSVLDGSYGPDKHKPLVVTLVPGTNGNPDMLELRPHNTDRSEYIPLVEVYRTALRRRIG